MGSRPQQRFAVPSAGPRLGQRRHDGLVCVIEADEHAAGGTARQPLTGAFESRPVQQFDLSRSEREGLSIPRSDAGPRGPARTSGPGRGPGTDTRLARMNRARSIVGSAMLAVLACMAPVGWASAATPRHSVRDASECTHAIETHQRITAMLYGACHDGEFSASARCPNGRPGLLIGYQAQQGGPTRTYLIRTGLKPVELPVSGFSSRVSTEDC